jgi:hypothetical protein
VLCEALTDAPETTLIVTPVLPVTATTGVLLASEQVTVVPLAGAVLLHCAALNDGKAASRSKATIALAALRAIVPTFLSPCADQK